jgi:hypothetical protein
MNSRLTAIISLAMATLCWLGLGYLMLSHPPDTLERMLFLSLLFLGMSFTCAPLLLAVHARLAPAEGEASWRQGAAWREAGLLGLFCSLCAWLRFIRVLSWVNGLLLAAVLALTEVLLVAWER